MPLTSTPCCHFRTSRIKLNVHNPTCRLVCCISFVYALVHLRSANPPRTPSSIHSEQWAAEHPHQLRALWPFTSPHI